MAIAMNEDDYTLLMNIKLEVCKILQLYLDLKLKTNFEDFIASILNKDEFKAYNSEQKMREYLIGKFHINRSKCKYVFIVWHCIRTIEKGQQCAI